MAGAIRAQREVSEVFRTLNLVWFPVCLLSGKIEDSENNIFSEFTTLREIGIVLPNSQRQHRTLHIQKDVLPYALCLLLCPVSAALASMFRMDLVSTSYPQWIDGFECPGLWGWGNFGMDIYVVRCLLRRQSPMSTPAQMSMPLPSEKGLKVLSCFP